MYRVDDVTAVAALPAPPTDSIGSPGYFTGGNPGASPPLPATKVRFWWLNLVQESLMALLSATGLAPNKNDSTLVLQAVSIIGRRSQKFSTPGVSSWTVPSGVYLLKVRLSAGGGGGSGSPTSGTGWSGSGGGAGGYAEKVISTTPGTVYLVTVGNGGAAGGADSSGSAGGTSSFGSVVSATPGQGGIANGGGGIGGIGVGGDRNFTGSIGSDGVVSGIAGALYVGTGQGGAGAFPGVGTAGSVSHSADATGPGCGGGGAYFRNALFGGNGGPGIVIVEY